ncbi:hypothetical protein HPP92_001886 [Vanilla planifolia]|uniref:Heme O synthase n=1 Tax=Vanilla planifolia TaxID=51239 RepID=A0A835RRH3_VANPL|nr:hypothetical protein HPP92_001886 [Vanilla planifolia]
MWRRAVAGGLNVFPNRLPIHSFAPSSAPLFLAPSASGDALVDVGRFLSSAARIRSVADPWKLGGLRKLSAGSRVALGSAASGDGSSTKAAEVLESLGSSPSVLSQKVRAISEVVDHYGRCYWELSKARLSMLVVATSGAGYVLGSGHVIDFAGLCCTCAGTMMVAASANTLNQVFEVKNDAKMKRTRHRPLPSGRITVPHAVTWASIIGISGTTLLAWKANYLAAGFAASNLFLYAFVYTPLKQIHPVNTWVGAVVGAIPPLLGWAAASGEVTLNAMILPAALYFWQIPHFMALAYMCRNDYVSGGFQMFSLADASGWRTAWVSLRNCLYLLPLGFLAYDWGITTKWFAIESSIITLFISAAAVLFIRARTAKTARRMFRASLLYLPVFMSGMLLHRLPLNDQEAYLVVSSSQDEELLRSSGDEGLLGFEKEHMHAASPPVAYASVAPFPFLPVPLYH